MFNKALISVFTISTLLLIPFSYLYYRDVYSKGDVLGSEISGCTPYNLEITVRDDGAPIKWLTTEECVSYIMYSDSINGVNDGKLLVSGEGFLPRFEHSAFLPSDSRGSRYYFYVIADEVEFGDQSKPFDLSFDL